MRTVVTPCHELDVSNGFPCHLRVEMGMQVDEAGGDDHARGG